MPTTSTHLDDLHAAVALLPGVHQAALQALSGLPDDVFTTALDFAVLVGQIVHADGQYWAREVCTTCGFGGGDRYYSVSHPRGVCDTNPVDYCAGYPIPA